MCLQVDLVQSSIADVGRLRLQGVDTVVMNPPFGTRRKGADIEFLRVGLQACTLTLPTSRFDF